MKYLRLALAAVCDRSFPGETITDGNGVEAGDDCKWLRRLGRLFDSGRDSGEVVCNSKPLARILVRASQALRELGTPGRNPAAGKIARPTIRSHYPGFFSCG